MQKKCTKCKNIKNIEEFHNNKNTKDGLGTHCKNCIKEYYNENKEKTTIYQKKWNDENKEYKKQWYEDNKPMRKPALQKTQLQKEHKSKYMKQYYLDNKERIDKLNVEYKKKKLESDPLYKFSHIIRATIWNAFAKRKYTKSKKTENILGCSIKWFEEYIESLFTEGMSWELIGKEIHLDHIIPISIARNEKEVIMLNHWTNFQPLWADENRKKSDKLDFK